jgi:hypothetical protein
MLNDELQQISSSMTGYVNLVRLMNLRSQGMGVDEGEVNKQLRAAKSGHRMNLKKKRKTNTVQKKIIDTVHTIKTELREQQEEHLEDMAEYTSASMSRRNVTNVDDLEHLLEEAMQELTTKSSSAVTPIPLALAASAASPPHPPSQAVPDPRPAKADPPPPPSQATMSIQRLLQAA